MNVLLLASLLFYGWGEPIYLVIMLMIIAINHCAALLIDKYRQYAFWLVSLTVAVNLILLGYFKYFNFILENVSDIFALKIDIMKIVMPIGISFYTFQAMSYVIDVYRKEVPVERDLHKTALYIALFPQLVAGPIVKYHDIAEQLSHRDFTAEMIAKGIERFIVGLSKKVLIANSLGIVADEVFAIPVANTDVWIAWLGAVCYSFQLYFDFSGYSDMAIGLGLMFGFRFIENFNYPYIAESITEFWRCWHISLSTWFKHYLYIPLGGNRKGLRRTCLNLLIVFFVTGFWHGANWTFILWGIWHGVIIIIEKLTGWNKKGGSVLLKIFKHLVTLLLVLIGWVIFRADSVTYGLDYLANMFGLVSHAGRDVIYGEAYFYDKIQLWALAVAVVGSTPITKSFVSRFEGNIFFQSCYRVVLMGLFVLSCIFISANTYNPFIYFRF